MSALSGGFDPTEIKRWDPKTQERVAGILEDALEHEPQAWYCTRGRTCDGRPHDGYDYKHARGDQWPPPGQDWFVWLIISGRGAGKTRTGAEWVRKMSEKVPRIAGIGQTVSDIRVTMVEGESGLEHVCRRAGIGYEWEPSKREFRFANGSLVSFFSAEEPRRLRGPQFGAGWLDEPAHMDNIDEVWSNLLFGMRNLGAVEPKILCTSTPLPIQWLKDLMKDEDTRTVRVSSYVNSDNLAKAYKKNVLGKFEGTRKGRQEIHGEILEEVEGALWTWDDFNLHRDTAALYSAMDRIVVGVDPAGTSTRKSDETGIVVVGVRDGEFYVFADGSGKMRPEGWAHASMNLYDSFQADAIVAEKNYGGEMVQSTLTNVDSLANVKMVTSRRGKRLRAEPIVALYQQGKVHHVGEFERLEQQMLEWVPNKSDSPDRIDALVHAITELGNVPGETEIAVPQPRPMPRTGGSAQFAPYLTVLPGGRPIGLRSTA